MAAQQAKNPVPKPAEDTTAKTLKQRQAENKEALRKHQASMERLKAFEAKLHPPPAGGEVQKEKSALEDMFFDGSNLNKDASATRTKAGPTYHQKESPATAVRSVAHTGAHEKDTSIKGLTHGVEQVKI